MSQTKVKSGLLNFPDQTDFVKLPSGTTAQRPSSPEKGYSRYNTTDDKLEYWNGTVWQQLPGVVAPTIESVSYPGDDLAADPAGGQTITLTGTNFLDGATVEIEGTLAPVVTVVSKTEITFTTPAKTAGDYDILLTNGDNTTATFIDGITYNGLPSWTTPAGNLGTFPAGSTIPTITLVATEPDSGVVSYSVTTGALPTGLTLTGADIDGTVPSPAGQTTYNFSVTASDDENQESTERAFNIVVYLQVTNTVSEVDPFGDSSGVALYKLDGDATDESGNYNGTANNITWGGAGVFVTSASFNGSNSNISLPVSTYLQSTGNKSYSVWFKTSVTSGNHSLFDDYTTGSGGINHHHYIRGDSGQLQFVTYRPAPTAFVGETSGLSLNDGNWHHLVVVSDNSNSRVLVYVDNNLEITLTGLPAFTQGKTEGYLGSYNSAGTGYSWDGEMDQLRIFNRSLLPLEVESLYRERTVVCGGQADTLDILGDNSCIATYQLNGNANDLSGNYSGTPTDVSYGVGEFDLAGVFNGASSVITLPNSIETSIISNSTFTVSGWFNTNSVSTRQFIIQMYQDMYLTVYVKETGTLSANVSNSAGTNSDVDGTTILSPNTWYHFCWTGEINNLNLYLNGNIEGYSDSWNGSFYNLTNVQPRIGARGISPQYYFNGEIDQVRIFNKALNSTEVTTLYNETACDAYEEFYDQITLNSTNPFNDSSEKALYRFENNANDSEGINNGSAVSLTYTAGYIDQAASFNGSSSYIYLNNVRYAFPFSISVWFKSTGTTTQTIYTDLGGGRAIYLSLMSDGKVRQASINSADGFIPIYSDLTYNDGQWHHAVAVFGSSKMNLYVNGGIKAISAPFVYGSRSYGTNPSIGGSFSGGGISSPFNGQLDQIRIFNKELSIREIASLYNEKSIE